MMGSVRGLNGNMAAGLCFSFSMGSKFIQNFTSGSIKPMPFFIGLAVINWLVIISLMHTEDDDE